MSAFEPWPKDGADAHPRGEPADPPSRSRERAMRGGRPIVHAERDDRERRK